MKNKDIILFENFDLIQDEIHSEIAIKTLHIIIQIQMFHWQAFSYKEHKIFDTLGEEFKELGDKLVEVISGVYGRIHLPDDLNLPLRNYSDLDPVGFIDQAIDIYNVYQTNIVQEQSEIVGIIDDIVALFNQTKYLLSFK